jgi:hypothetical protein
VAWEEGNERQVPIETLGSLQATGSAQSTSSKTDEEKSASADIGREKGVLKRVNSLLVVVADRLCPSPEGLHRATSNSFQGAKRAHVVKVFSVPRPTLIMLAGLCLHFKR